MAMKLQVKATFKITSWNENPIHASDGLPKLTRASVTQSFEGDITGQGIVEYLMSYRDDGSATYAGILRVVGAMSGRSGSFVLVGEGSYSNDKGEAVMNWRGAPGSGTGGPARAQGARG